jgi:cytochrome b561
MPLAAARIDRPRDRHSGWTIALHWSTVVAVVLAAAAVLWREWVEDDALRALLMQVHRQAGLFVLVALGGRLAVRAALGMADHAGPLPRWMRAAAQLAHIAMYGALLVLTLLGWAACNASAMDLTLFGLLRLPVLTGDDPDLAGVLKEFHVWAAWGLLLMVVAHVAAALWHHLVRRDGVLHAMLPWLRRRD